MSRASTFSPSLYSRLLRTPADVARDCKDDRELSPIAASSIVAIVVGALLFGAAVGSWQGGWQIAFAAVKLTLVTIGTLVVCVPAFHAITAVFGRPWSLRATLSIMLVAGARFSLILLAATPVLWLTVNLGAPYHLVKLLAALAYALGGLAALGLLLRSLGRGADRLATVVAFVGVFLLVGAQAAWVMRPYLGDPSRGPVTFFTNQREGGVAYQLYVSARELIAPSTPR
jgi:hypothetical protein